MNHDTHMEDALIPINNTPPTSPGPNKVSHTCISQTPFDNLPLVDEKSPENRAWATEFLTNLTTIDDLPALLTKKTIEQKRLIVSIMIQSVTKSIDLAERLEQPDLVRLYSKKRTQLSNLFIELVHRGARLDAKVQAGSDRR
ncbi:hypothetical protein ACJ41O_001620 [Fusarium nematophilum]